MVENKTVVKLILAFLAIIVGVAFATTTSEEVYGLTYPKGVDAEALDISSARICVDEDGLASNDINQSRTFTVANTGNRTGGIVSGSVAIYNKTGSSKGQLIGNPTGAPNYTMCYDGTNVTIQFYNTTFMVYGITNSNASGWWDGNNTLIDYQYYGDDYLTEGWHRTVLKLTPGFFAIALFIFAGFLVISIFKDYGLANL